MSIQITESVNGPEPADEVHAVHDLEIGLLVGLSDDGIALVTFASNATAEAMPARTTLDLMPADVGRAVALLFEKGDVAYPVVIGRMRGEPREKRVAQALQADIDGRIVSIVAKERIRLVCGKSSLTLEADGTIDITGVHIENRASGQNKLKGASIALN